MHASADLPVTLTLRAHMVWERKANFQLDADTYPAWVAFAVEAGEFRYRIGPAEGIAGAGAVVLCPPGIAFERKTVRPLTFHFLQFDVSPPVDGAALAAWCGDLTPEDARRTASHLHWLRRLALSDDAHSRQWRSLILTDLWHLIGTGRDPGADAGLPVGGDSLMNEAAERIRRDACGRLSLEALAGALGLSPVQFTRRFRAAFRQTPSAYLIALRLRHAADLLLSTDLTLEEIAARCGYENGFYLSRLFKRHMRVSPSEYRRTRRV